MTVTGMDMDKVTDDLRVLEQSLWVEETRFDNDYMEKICASEFIEFGKSGRIFSREQCLALAQTKIRVILPLINFRVVPIATDVCLVTYTTETRDKIEPRDSHQPNCFVNRSSVWRRHGDQWRLYFHQGTPA